MEASGTGNMKFALNGALTIGTLDGANVEMREHVGDDNIFIFGLTADEVAARRARGLRSRAPSSRHRRELSQALAAIASGVFSPDDPRPLQGLVDGLYDHDWFMVAADFDAYAAAQRDVDRVWRTADAGIAKAIHNTARMGWFSSDRTISEYARRDLESADDEATQARPKGTDGDDMAPGRRIDGNRLRAACRSIRRSGPT